MILLFKFKWSILLPLVKRKTPNHLSAALIFACCISACTDTTSSISNKENEGYFDYGTKNDSARYYFIKGWEEILDNGRWTESEEAFGKQSNMTLTGYLAKVWLVELQEI